MSSELPNESDDDDHGAALVMRNHLLTKLNRLFTEHPTAVGETYTEHAFNAAIFGMTMMFGALAAFLHAAVPGVCTSTGSRIIARLYDRMVVNRTQAMSTRSKSLSDTEFIAENI